MNLTLAHFEHALPVLQDLGLEHLIPLLVGGGALDVSALVPALTKAGTSRAFRRLVAIAEAPGSVILAWETDPSLQAAAEQSAALAHPQAALEAILGFFAAAGISLNVSPDSSETGVAVGRATPGDTQSDG